MLTAMTAVSMTVRVAVSGYPSTEHLIAATRYFQKEIDMEIMIDRQKFNTFIEDFSRDYHYCTLFHAPKPVRRHQTSTTGETMDSERPSRSTGIKELVEKMWMDCLLSHNPDGDWAARAS